MKTQLSARALVASLALLGAALTGCLTPSMEVEEVRLQAGRSARVVVAGNMESSDSPAPTGAQLLPADGAVAFTLTEGASGGFVHVSSADRPEGDERLFGAVDVPISGVRPVAEGAAGGTVYLLSASGPGRQTLVDPLPGNIKIGGGGG